MKKEKHVGGNFRLVKETYYGVQYYPNLFGKIITILLFPIYVIRDGWSDAVDTVKDILSENCSYTFWIFDDKQIKYCESIDEETK